MNRCAPLPLSLDDNQQTLFVRRETSSFRSSSLTLISNRLRSTPAKSPGEVARVRSAPRRLSILLQCAFGEGRGGGESRARIVKPWLKISRQTQTIRSVSIDQSGDTFRTVDISESGGDIGLCCRRLSHNQSPKYFSNMTGTLRNT